MEPEAWALSIVDLSEESAKLLIEHAKGLGLDGFAVDPAYFYVRHLDRGSVEITLKLLAAGLEAIGADLEDFERWGGISAIDDMKLWLEQAAEAHYD